MNWWNRLFRRSRLEEQLDKELGFHLELHTADLIERGVPPSEARRQARMALGGPEQVKEECRDARGTRWLEGLWQDGCYALRMFAKNPGATSVAAISLALAIGPNAALFGVVDRVLLRPVTVPGVSQMFFLSVKGERNGVWENLSYPDFLDYQSGGHGIADCIASDSYEMMLGVDGVNEPVSMEMVSENYFPVLGVRAALDRTLIERDARFEGATPVMLSYSLWQRRFGGASDIVGKTVTLGFQPSRVVGVALRDFREPTLHRPFDVWIPLSAAPLVDQRTREVLARAGPRRLDVTVRLRDGVSQRQAESALSAIAMQLAKAYPATNRGRTVVLRPVDDPRKVVVGALVLSLASMVLFIGCANVAGILLGQGEARRREFTVRLALGAGRRRLLRQLLSETLLLVLVSAALGLLLALWLMRAAATVPEVGPGLHLNARLLAYTLALSMVSTLAAGLLPALRASCPDLTPVLKGDASGGKSRPWFRTALVIGQIACSQCLLVGTGLFMASDQHAQQIRPGFDIGRNVLFATVVATNAGPSVDYETMLDRLRAIPGVRRVSSVSDPPLNGSGLASHRVSISGVIEEPVQIAGNYVDSGYFTAMGTRILRGRDFVHSDTDRAAIVNEEMARRFWGDASRAIGQPFRVEGKDRQIAGVVETGKYRSLLEDPMPFFSLCTRAAGSLVIETAGSPAAMAEPVRKALSGPGITVKPLLTLREEVGLAYSPWRAKATLLGGFAFLGIFLAGVGLYGVVSHGIASRVREIAVRMAMGARPADVLRIVLRQGLWMVAVGAGIGTAGAVMTARVVSALLYRVSPADPLALFRALLAVAAVTLLAIQIPARRAIHTDPMAILRSE